MNDNFQLSEQQKQKAIKAIKDFFEVERGESIGDLAAMLILDFFCETLGAIFYNLGIEEAGKFIGDKLEDLYGLEK